MMGRKGRKMSREQQKAMFARRKGMSIDGWNVTVGIKPEHTTKPRKVEEKPVIVEAWRIKKEIFSPHEIGLITRRTNINFHTENYIFIAKKINSPLEKEFVKIKKESDKLGHLSDPKKRYKLFQKLMKELEEKHPADFDKINQRL